MLQVPVCTASREVQASKEQHSLRSTECASSLMARIFKMNKQISRTVFAGMAYLYLSSITCLRAITGE
jgi:hypothetical protein